MSGERLVQLADALLGLKATLDAALSAASLPLLEDLVPEHEAGVVKRRPLLTVALTGDRNRNRFTAESEQIERLPVTFRLRLDATQAQALAYEGTLTVALVGLRTALRAAVTDARLDAWELTGGALEADAGRKNVVAWTVTMTCQATLQWET